MRPVIRLFSSVRLTVGLLLALAAVMAVGTVYEAEHGAAAVRLEFWRAPWFDGFLLLLAANLVACTYTIQPSRTTRWAYLLVHQSILVIFAGALVGRWWGMEAQLQLREGEELSELVSDASTLAITVSRPRSAPVSHVLATERIDAFPAVHEPNLTWDLGDGLSIRARRYYPDAEEVETVVPGGPGDPFAAEVELQYDGQSARRWVLARSPAIVAGPLKVSLVEGDPPTLEKTTAGGVPGRSLVLTGPGGSFSARIDVEGKVGEKIPVPGTTLSLTVKRLFSRFALHGQEPEEDPEAPENPAIAFTIEGPGVSETRLAFATHPEFDDVHGQKGSGVKARFEVRSRELVFYAGRNGTLTGRYLGQTKAVTGPIETGRPYPIDEVPGLAVAVARVLPGGRLVREVVNRSNQPSRPAIELSLECAGAHASTWVFFAERRELPFAGGTARLEYGRQRIPLGFSVKLDRFTIGRHPGSSQPASFESRVTVRDATAGDRRDVTISMNNPLVHRGFTFYQSSYFEGTPMTSVLQVTRDPGGPIAYVGFIAFMVGLFLSLWARSRREPRPAGSPAEEVQT